MEENNIRISDKKLAKCIRAGYKMIGKSCNNIGGDVDCNGDVWDFPNKIGIQIEYFDKKYQLVCELKEVE